MFYLHREIYDKLMLNIIVNKNYLKAEIHIELVKKKKKKKEIKKIKKHRQEADQADGFLFSSSYKMLNTLGMTVNLYVGNNYCAFII